ncbi:pyridoxamine 5'-phosphate oxidase family protein [Sorangium sp. So ce1014]|uniref:pyridoxamine 5'-phosphate oxidase family protein n=1 Tax=Sorangium sp. So ce1014 TaxID=3133326 RepID=UPI003F610337
MGELHALLREFDTAMLVTMTPEGLMRGRPMEIQEPAELMDCDLWFVTQEETAKTGEIAREQQVAVCCYRPRDRAYISISARATIDRNEEKIRSLWKPSWKTWLPDGPAHPHAAILRLNVERAEYWEPEGGRLRILYEKAKALVQRKPASDKLNPPKHI